MDEKISQITLISQSQAGDRHEMSRFVGGTWQTFADTTENISDFVNIQGVNTTSVEDVHTLSLDDIKSFIYYPSLASDGQLFLPSSGEDPTIPIGFTCVVNNDPSNTHNVLIESIDTIVGGDSILPGTTAFIVKNDTAEWTVQYMINSVEITGPQDICGITVTVPSTNGAQLTLVPYTFVSYLANNFLQGAQSYIYINIPMPKRWNGGTVVFSADWTASVTSGNVVWTVDAGIVSGSLSYDVSFGTPQSVTTAAPSLGANRCVSTTGPITPDNTAVVGANNNLILRVGRNAGAGSDTMAGNAYLMSWNLRYTAIAGNDN